MAGTKGKCLFCSQRFSKKPMFDHLRHCKSKEGFLKTIKKRSNTNIKWYHVRAEGKGLKKYWLNLLIPSDLKLFDLDLLLRETWLECCGHLSLFSIDGLEYEMNTEDYFGDITEEDLDVISKESKEFDDLFPDEFKIDPNEEAAFNDFSKSIMLGDQQYQDLDDDFDQHDLDSRTRSMNEVVGTIFHKGLKFEHIYDFGSTTIVQLEVIDEERSKYSLINPILMARNALPIVKCDLCSSKSKYYCYECVWDDQGYLCQVHSQDFTKNHDPDHEMIDEFANSPRFGVCGYIN